MRLLNRIRAVAIDLDGTLIDSVPDLTYAANEAVASLGLRPLSEARIESFIGNGIPALVERAVSASAGRAPDAATLDRALQRFYQIYAENLFVRGRLYPGVATGLDALRSEAITLACITNKAERFARPLLAAAGIDAYFTGLFAPRHVSERKPQPVLLLRACEALGVTPGDLLVIGDSRADVGAARAAGCPVAAVDYGYHHGRLRGELAPDWLISSLAEVVALPASPPAVRPEPAARTTSR